MRPGPKLRVGFLRLTDAAPLIVAHEFGFFNENGVDAELVREPSWANIADKLTYGLLDAAIVLPPLAFAIHLGLRGVAQPLLIPCGTSLGGNTVTLSTKIAARVQELETRKNISANAALAQSFDGGRPPIFGVVHAYSTHNLLLRYWLRAAGLEPGRDVKITVVPPALAVGALQSGQIDGFCAGAPWGDIAARSAVGASITTSHDIWNNSPEKAFAVRENWGKENPEALAGAIRALLRAAQFCDAPENASYIGALLSRRKYLDVDAHAIMSSLPGGAIASNNVSVFYRNAAMFPWRSHGLWFLREMARWNLIGAEHKSSTLAERIYRPDLFRAAVAPLGIAVPSVDTKIEGRHSAAWSLDTPQGSLAMGPDLFCDGAIFDPAQPN